MSAYSLSCPRCGAVLRSAGPIEPGRMIRCPQCGDHFNQVDHGEWTAPVASAGSPALKTGLLAFGLVGLLFLLATAALVVAVNKKNDSPHEPATARAEHRHEDEQLVALRRRIDEQQAEIEHERKLREQAVRDLEAKAKVAEARPLVVQPVITQPAAAPDPKPAANAAAKKVRADYDARMDAGRVAMVAERYADALREYTAALTLMPGDAAAARGQLDAENRLEGKQDRQKRQAAFAGLLDRAKTALSSKRYDEALDAANQALRIVPNDTEARQIQRDATQAKRTTRADNSDLLALADDALANGRYEEASRLYDRVLQQSPSDEAALRGKRAADQVTQDTQAGLSAYFRFMAVGTLSMQNAQYADAVRAFGEALRLVPTDLAAARALRDAQLALTGAVVGQANFYRQLQAGYAALQAKRPADAITAFQAALRLVPDSPLAAAGLRQARAMQK